MSPSATCGCGVDLPFDWGQIQRHMRIVHGVEDWPGAGGEVKFVKGEKD